MVTGLKCDAVELVGCGGSRHFHDSGKESVPVCRDGEFFWLCGLRAVVNGKSLQRYSVVFTNSLDWFGQGSNNEIKKSYDTDRHGFTHIQIASSQC